MLFVLVILIRRLHWSNFKMQWLYLPIWCVLSTWISSLRTLLTHLYNITTKKTTTTIKQSCARHQFGSYTFTSSAAAPGHFCVSHFNNSWQLCDAFKGVIKCSSLTWLALHTHLHSLACGRGYDGTNSLPQQCPTWYSHHSVCRGKASSFHLFSPSIKDISTSAGTIVT